MIKVINRELQLTRFGNDLLVALPELRVVDAEGRATILFTLDKDKDVPNKWYLNIPDGVDNSTLDGVISAHDNTIPWPAEVEVQNDNATLDDLSVQYQNMMDGLTNIRTRMATINTGPNNPNSAQTGTALKILASDVTTMCNGLERLLKTFRVFVKRQS
jgi:hypothetical protein